MALTKTLKRWPYRPIIAHNPKMSPVQVGNVIAFLKGNASVESLAEAARLDPELEALKKESRSFIRRFGGIDEDS